MNGMIKLTMYGSESGFWIPVDSVVVNETPEEILDRVTESNCKPLSEPLSR